MATTSAPVSRVPVDMAVRGPLPIVLEDASSDGSITPAGCYVLDLTFQQPVQVAEIFFHNFYTAWITVMVRTQPTSDSGLSGTSGSSSVCSVVNSNASGREIPWLMAIPRRNLMPNPHLETGSHDFVSILATESIVPWIDLTGIRLLLRQPSPSWITFHIEEIRVFSEPPRRRKNTDFQLNLPFNSTSSRSENETYLLSLRRNTLSALRVALPSTQQQQQTMVPTSLPAAGSHLPKPRLREMAALYEIANLLPT